MLSANRRLPRNSSDFPMYKGNPQPRPGLNLLECMVDFASKDSLAKVLPSRTTNGGTVRCPICPPFRLKPYWSLIYPRFAYPP